LSGDIALGGSGRHEARFEVSDGGRARVTGTLHFATVSGLLGAGIEALGGGRAAVIDLSGVTASDSAGLALLIEWVSAAKGANRPLRFEHVPSQLLQLARLSEVEDLLVSA
jgi:phospholipid transport system transporter-binding protein